MRSVYPAGKTHPHLCLLGAAGTLSKTARFDQSLMHRCIARQASGKKRHFFLMAGLTALCWTPDS